MIWSPIVILGINLQGEYQVLGHSVIMIIKYFLSLMYPLIWCVKVVDFPFFGDIDKLGPEHQIIKYAKKCCWRIFVEKNRLRMICIFWSAGLWESFPNHFIFHWCQFSRFLFLSWSLPTVYPQFTAYLE